MRGMKIVTAANGVTKQEFYTPCIPSASVFVTAYIVVCLCYYLVLYKGQQILFGNLECFTKIGADVFVF